LKTTQKIVLWPLPPLQELQSTCREFPSPPWELQVTQDKKHMHGVTILERSLSFCGKCALGFRQRFIFSFTFIRNIFCQSENHLGDLGIKWRQYWNYLRHRMQGRGLDWSGKRRALLNIVMEFWVPWKAGNFSTS
jgi:hypothetical protein